MPTGIKDTERRERIARAAIRVVAESGVEGLTHRAVATAADVPLGSTTYYFDSLDDLLGAALSEAMAIGVERFGAWSEQLSADSDLASALASLLVEVTGPNREWTVVEYELYVAALRRPSLQHLSLEWADAIRSILNKHVDPLTAEALSLASDGIALKSLIRGSPLTSAEVEPVLRRIINGQADAAGADLGFDR